MRLFYLGRWFAKERALCGVFSLDKIKKEYDEFRLLMRSVPPITLTLFVMSVFAMNLLANKSISLPVPWLALDCGIIVSWFSFLTMDIITVHFGPKAANEVSLLSVFLNLAFCLVFFIGSQIPGVWGESYVPGSEALLNGALNRTFGGSWYVLFGSTVAFTTAAFVNNFLNYIIGKAFKKNPGSFAAYVSRTYVSTSAGQFVDNLVFALLVSHFFFGWTLLQCVTCAVTGMVVELLCEVVFSYLGFQITTAWKRAKIGEAYLAYRRGMEK